MVVQPGYRHPAPADDEPPAAIAAAPERELAGDAWASLEQRIAALETAGRADTGSRADGDGSGRGDRGVNGDGPRHGGDVVIDDRDVEVAPPRGGEVATVSETWGDFDNDGLDDVIVLDPTASAKLLKNLGTGRFQDVTATANLGPVADGARLALWQDYDADHHLDLLLVGEKGAASLLRGAGNGVFEDVTAVLDLDFGQPIVAAEWVDYDADGTVDLRVELGDGRLVMHHGLGQGRFQEIELRPASSVAAENAALQERVAALEAMVQALLDKESK